MLDGVEEVKEWFQEQRLERRITIIELWRDGDADQLEEQTGEYIGAFREMMEQIREANSFEDMTEEVLKDELQQEGFETPVILTIVDSIEESIGPRDDVIFLKRNTSPDDLREVVILALDFYLGKISLETARERARQLGSVDATDESKSGGLEVDMLNRAYRFLQATIRASIDYGGGIARFKSETEASTGLGDEKLEALFEPIEDHLEELQRFYIYQDVRDMKDTLGQLDERFDGLEDTLRELSSKLT